MHASRSEWRERSRSNVVHADARVDWFMADGLLLLALSGGGSWDGGGGGGGGGRGAVSPVIVALASSYQRRIVLDTSN